MQHEKKITREMAANLESTCGEPARYADHAVGEMITYKIGHEVRTGIILFVAAPQQVMSQHIPLTYVTDSNHGFPDLIYATDIIESPLS